MSRDLLGDFGFSQPQPQSNVNDLLGLFNNDSNGSNTGEGLRVRPAVQAASSEATVSGHSTTLFFSSSPQQESFDDFGDFAEEPLPSSNPSFGPLSNSSPPQKPSISVSRDQSVSIDDDFGAFISTPHIPSPPLEATFNLQSNLTNPNHAHPPNPPPPLHILLPLLTSQLLSPVPFLTRLKPLSYPAKQRLLSSTNLRVKNYFTALILTTHVVGRLISSKRSRLRKNYKNSSLSTSRQEQLKDDREIGECVREYSSILGSLRAVVRGMGLSVPELSTDMAISTTKPSKKKGVTGKDEFCWLCGLSPLDRVIKLKEDEGILESEKDIDGNPRWIGGWGHRGCKNWWEGCHHLLK